MEKLKMHSLDNVDENIKKIGKLFPNCITEKKNDSGEIEYAIDFDILKQELSNEIVEGNQERYQFTWPDKKKSMLLANTPIAKTLRPCKEESVDFDTTENLYIEGDNLEVLKLLQETYLGKIKMIYIDPPYNTGNDFVYEDNFSQKSSDYLENSGQFDEEGNRLVKNLESNGRFHTDWLNMMYPRLKLARNLLTEDGVIFISIDDNELANLEKICNEIFGEDNFQANISIVTNPGGRDYKEIAITNESLLIYTKSFTTKLNEIPKIVNFKLMDENGGYELRELRNRNPKFTSRNRPNLFYPFYVNPNLLDKDSQCPVSLTMKDDYTTEVYPYNSKREESCWRWGREKASKAIVDNNTNKSQIVAKQKRDNNWNIYEKNRKSTTKVKSLWNESNMRTESGTREFNSLFDDSYFNHPKSVDLVKRCIELGSKKEDIILDFFAGSSTTAQACMQINSEGEGSRKYILVQIPELTDQNSSAYKAGYKNICEIGKERIRRAGKKIKEETPLTTQNLDIGFRVLKCDSNNMKDVYYKPEEYEADLFDSLKDNIKEDRTSEDLLFQVMLDLGVLLSSTIQETIIEDKKIFNVANGYLLACFDENITENIIIEIAKQKPYYFVMRDSSLADDNVLSNFDQIFATYSPDTIRKVL